MEITEEKIREFQNKVIDALAKRYNMSDSEAKEMAEDFMLEDTIRYNLKTGRNVFEEDLESWAEMIYDCTPGIIEIFGKQSKPRNEVTEDIIDGDTKVVINGYGEPEYPNIPTFQETTTLGKSLLMIKEYLKGQTKYEEISYIFAINRLEDKEYIYCYIDGDVGIAEKYRDDKRICEIIHQNS